MPSPCLGHDCPHASHKRTGWYKLPAELRTKILLHVLDGTMHQQHSDDILQFKRSTRALLLVNRSFVSDVLSILKVVVRQAIARYNAASQAQREHQLELELKYGVTLEQARTKLEFKARGRLRNVAYVYRDGSCHFSPGYLQTREQARNQMLTERKHQSFVVLRRSHGGSRLHRTYFFFDKRAALDAMSKVEQQLLSIYGEDSPYAEMPERVEALKSWAEGLAVLQFKLCDVALWLGEGRYGGLLPLLPGLVDYRSRDPTTLMRIQCLEAADASCRLICVCSDTECLGSDRHGLSYGEVDAKIGSSSMKDLEVVTRGCTAPLE